jgi:hypothetical protein
VVVIAVVLAGMAATWLCAAALRFAGSYVLDWALGPDEASCAEALAFGAAKLPEGAHDARCTVETWQGSTYDATFRMPRDGVHAWLKSAYPRAPKPETEGCGKGTDLCLDLNGGGDHAPPAGAAADAVTVEVTYEAPGTARVTFTAFTV